METRSAYTTEKPEARTCRQYVVPRLTAAGWLQDPHSVTEQKEFTDGRIRVRYGTAEREEKKRADYLLNYRPDFPIAVVEAKPDYAIPAQGMQQAKQYADILGLKFAYATNGTGIVEFDYTTGLETPLDSFPSPPRPHSSNSRFPGMRSLLALCALAGRRPRQDHGRPDWGERRRRPVFPYTPAALV